MDASATPDLDTWIADIKSRDAMTFEDAYHGPRPTGSAVVPRLIAEMHSAEDGYTRGKFIELLAEMGDTMVVPHLIPELTHRDQTVRHWAVIALEMLGGEAAIEAVARYKSCHADEFI